jgi:hypothetical protein
MTGAPRGLAAAARRLLPYLALGAGLAAVYEPILRSSALFNDDYANFVEAPPYAWMLGAAGRPVQYVLAGLAHRLIAADVGHVATVRFTLFALWVALAAVVFRTVRRGVGEASAVALVLFAFSVPAYLITFAWLSVAINVPAYLAAAGSYATGYLLLGRARSAPARAALGAATLVLVVVASLTYQIAAALPLGLVVYHLLFEAKEGAVVPRRAIVMYALVCAGLVLSVVALRVILRYAGLPLEDRAQGTLARIASPRGLLLPFRIFDANFALHYYYWGWLTREAAVLLGGALSVVVIRVAWREVRFAHPAHRENRLRWGLVAAGFLLAAMLFALDGSRELRSKPFLTLLLLFIVVYALRETPWCARLRPKRSAVWAVVLVTMWSGHHTLASGLVAYADAELAHVRDALDRAPPGALRRVHVIQPENRCFTPPCYGWFEFNLKLASSKDWVPRGLVRYALDQRGRRGEPVETTFSSRPPDDPAAFVIDMRVLERRLYAERGEVLDVARYLKRPRVLAPGATVRPAGLWLRVTCAGQSCAERPTP